MYSFTCDGCAVTVPDAEGEGEPPQSWGNLSVRQHVPDEVSEGRRLRRRLQYERLDLCPDCCHAALVSVKARRK